MHPGRVRKAWTDCAKEYLPSAACQVVKEIDSPLGWMQYQCKHAIRGVMHYQRSRDNMPKVWTSTGRMWGWWGEWPRSAPRRLVLRPSAYFRLRRILRGRAIARARGYDKKYIGKALVSARRMLSRTKGDTAAEKQKLSHAARPDRMDRHAGYAHLRRRGNPRGVNRVIRCCESEHPRRAVRRGAEMRAMTGSEGNI